MAAPTLKLCLLGAFDAEIDGETMPPFRLKKSLWALALLALRQGREVPRDWLAATLWPESEHTRALFNLRHTLTNDLRPRLKSAVHVLSAPTSSTLCLDSCSVWVDVAAFDSAIISGSLQALQTAVDLYRGPLLEGCMEEWVLTERVARHEVFHNALEHLATNALARSQPTAAVGHLRRLLASDPLRESGYATLMEALAASGDTAAVRQVYRDLRLLLHRELNAEPSAQTIALYERLQQSSRQPSLPEPAHPPEPTPPSSSSVSVVSPASCPPRRLPIPLTRLIGRERDIADVVDRFTQGRMVTLTGAGGVGKTRLAIAIAEALSTVYADGVWFVELAGLANPGLVASSVAQALQVKEQPGQTVTETLVERLASRSMLLVLDNCEHVLDACTQLVEALLSQCGGLRMIATSREVLGLFGEWVYRVPSLEVPPPPETWTGTYAEKNVVSRLLEYDAARLFVERSAAQSTRLRLTAPQSQAIADICAHLDGIPLAIEMAAARMRSLSIEQIHSGLDQRFRLLTGGSRSVLPRHRTLQALIDWSYDLLTAQEQALLRRLSVFVGGWTLEAAEAVCGGIEDATTEVPRHKSGTGPAEVFDLLSSLVDKSLVIYEDETTGTRYRMLETVRAYALQKRLEQEEEGRLEVRHRDWYVALAEEAYSKLKGPEQVVWTRRLEVEHDNLRAALSWSLKKPDARCGAALRLCGAMSAFWAVRGYLSEGQQWCEAALAVEEVSGRAAERARALGGTGVLHFYQGRYASARAYHAQSLAIRREIGDRNGIASSLGGLGNVAQEQGDYTSARIYYEQSLEILREVGDRYHHAAVLNNLGAVASYQGDLASAWAYHEQSLTIRREIGDQGGIAKSLGNLGTVAADQGDFALARAYQEQSLTIRREIGDRQGIANLLSNLGVTAQNQGDDALARAYYEQSLTIGREIGDQFGTANALGNLGSVAYDQGDFASARTYLEESLLIYHEIGHRQGITDSMARIAGLSAATGDLERGARLWGVAETQRVQIGLTVIVNDQDAYERDTSAAREAMGEAAFSAAWAQGRSMSLEEAVAYALFSDFVAGSCSPA